MFYIDHLKYHITNMIWLHWQLSNKLTINLILQRLKPGDPILSFRQCERHTFSMRPDREVRYCIMVQQTDNGDTSIKTTGIVAQKFGLGEKTSRSEVNHSFQINHHISLLSFPYFNTLCQGLFHAFPWNSKKCVSRRDGNWPCVI